MQAACLGREWNAETAFRRLVQPAVRTRLGARIAPIDKRVELHAAKKQKRLARMLFESTLEHERDRDLDAHLDGVDTGECDTARAQAHYIPLPPD